MRADQDVGLVVQTHHALIRVDERIVNVHDGVREPAPQPSEEVLQRERCTSGRVSAGTQTTVRTLWLTMWRARFPRD